MKNYKTITCHDFKFFPEVV